MFFVQSVLADRYIHRTELRLVSLESSSSVEYSDYRPFLIPFHRRIVKRKHMGYRS